MNTNTMLYGENVMRLSRLIAGWYQDIDTSARFPKNLSFLKFNMPLMCEIYTFQERQIAYAFMVKFNPTLRDMVGIINRDKFFSLVATLVQSNLTAIVYSRGL